MWRTTTIVVVLVFIVAHPIDAQHRSDIGFRDKLSAGLSFGTPTALDLSAQLANSSSIALAIGWFYGADIATWGIGEGYAVDLRVKIRLTDDGKNDALVFQPSAGIATLVGASKNGGWLKFDPYTDVHYAITEGAFVWAHEYPSVTLNLALGAGAAFAFDGRDKNNVAASGQTSFRLHFTIEAGFWR